MLTILGQSNRFCDGISRRGFLKIGRWASGGLTLADIFRAEARAGTGSSHKAVINIFLGGGPPHQDMWEIKTEAPADIRGEFKPIATNVTGVQIGEVFPQIAASMDKFAVIRSVVGASGGHDAFQCTTGYPPNSLSALGGRPGIGAVAARVQGPGRSLGAALRRFGGSARSMCRGRRRAAPGSSARPMLPSSQTAPAWPT